MEGVDDAHDGAEESDEGGDGGDGGEPGHALFHRGEGFGGGGLGGAFHCGGVAGEAAAAGLAVVLVVDFGEDGDERAGFELVHDGGDFAETRGFAEGADKACALGLGLAEAGPLGEHDGPGEDAGDEEGDEDGEGDGSTVVHHLQERAAVARGGGRSGGVFLLEEVQGKGED